MRKWISSKSLKWNLNPQPRTQYILFNYIQNIFYIFSFNKINIQSKVNIFSRYRACLLCFTNLKVDKVDGNTEFFNYMSESEDDGQTSDDGMSIFNAFNILYNCLLIFVFVIKILFWQCFNQKHYFYFICLMFFYFWLCFWILKNVF